MARKAERLQVLDQLTPPDLWPHIRVQEPRRPPQEPPTARRALVAALALAIAAAAIAFAVRAFEVTERTPRPASTIENGLLAFSGGGQIQVVSPDGGGLRQLTHLGGHDALDVHWSPDGSMLALRVWTNGHYQLYVASADGSDLTNITGSMGVGDLDWSPDGSMLAFTSFQKGNDDDVFVVNSDGSGLRAVVESPFTEHRPQWSPDGTRIAFEQWPVRDRDPGTADIYTVGVGGGEASPLITSPGYDTGVAWSPDGSRLAFTSDQGGDEEIYVVSADGSGERQLTNLPEASATEPAWSPDGTRLSFVAHDGEQWDVWVVNANGTGLLRLTPRDRAEGPAVWAPDGSLLAFTASGVTSGIDKTGTYDVYTIQPDGIDERRITFDSFAMGWDLDWQPVRATDATSIPSPSPQIDVSTVEIGHGGGIDVAVGEGGVWVSTIDGVVRIDPATGGVVGEVAIGEPPFECAFDLALGSGSVWATRGCEGGTEVVRIHPGTNQVVARVPLEQAYCVEVGEDAVWATASGVGVVVRIDPASNEVVETIPVDAGSGPGGIGCLGVGAGGVWVTRGGQRDSLVRIDPATNRVVATVDIPNPHYWNEVVVEDGMVWVSIGGPNVRLEDGTKTNVVRVVRIDPLTNEVVGEPIEVGHGMFGIGSGDGSVWVYDGFSDAITQIDAASGTVVRVIPVIDGGSSWGGDPGIDAADGLVWMAGGRVLNRIELSKG
jgi:Tol biopolymer transport system component/streptogramin lyase